MEHLPLTISIREDNLHYPNRDIYENVNEDSGVYARLEVDKDSPTGTIWIQSGLVGLFLSHEEFKNIYPLIKGYAEEVGIE